MIFRFILLFILFMASQSGTATTTKFTAHQYDVSHIALSEEIYGYDTNSNPLNRCQIPLSVNAQDKFFCALSDVFLVTKSVPISRAKYGDAADHIADAQKAGHPSTLTIARDGAGANRKASIGGLPKVSGKKKFIGTGLAISLSMLTP
jgi:hypothetical protein